MTLERRLAKLFRLNDESWMRHANPVSVWTRYTVLPVIVLAIWSRTWIGHWWLLPGVVSLLWMFLNPVLFSRPKSTKNWASKAVLGERVYLNRDEIPIPAKHRIALHVLLNGFASVGLLLAIVSAIYYWWWGAVFGVVITCLCKSWFLDRMVWLYEDMKHHDERYRSWEY